MIRVSPILQYAQKVVLHPSNVYTIDNPDILFIANDNLFGLFIPTKGEIQNVDLLTRRIMVSRLAYVENMKTLLLSEDKSFLDKNFQLLNRICHRILNNDANEYRSTFGKNTFASNIPEISAKIRAKQLKLYTHNIKIYQLGLDEKRTFSTFSIDKRFTDRAIVGSWSQSKIRVKEAYMLDDFFIAFKRKTTMSFKDTFNNLMTLSFFMNYTINDIGISYRKALKYPKMINSNFSFIRENGNDPYRYIRILAFMGLAPIQADSLNICLNIKDKLSKKWQNRINPLKRF